MTPETRLGRWERRLDWPITVVALLFLAAYALPILDPALPSGQQDLCGFITWASWALFALDYLVRLGLAPNRRRFFVRHLFDLAVVALPLLRPLRLLRLVILLKVMNRHASGTLRGRVVTYVIGSAALVLFVASLAILDAERGHKGATIQTFGDALWWAATTVTTVGYGDEYPVTETGRFVAVGLMLSGIALIGVVTATFASWLIERVQQVEEASRVATSRDVRELREEIEELRRLLEPPVQPDQSPSQRRVERDTPIA